MSEKNNIIKFPRSKPRTLPKEVSLDDMDLRTYKLLEYVDELTYTLQVHDRCIAALIKKIKKLENQLEL